MCSSAAAQRSLPGLHLSPAAVRTVSAVSPPACQTARSAASPAHLQLPAVNLWFSGVQAAWMHLMEKWLDHQLDSRIWRRKLILHENTDWKGYVTITVLHFAKVTSYNICLLPTVDLRGAKTLLKKFLV